MTIRVAHITTIDMSLRFLMLDQMNSLQSAGYDVVGISTIGENVPIIEAAGIKHFNVPITRKISPLQDLHSLLQLYKLFRHEKFTIVHTHNPKPGLLGQIAACLAGVPIVVNTLHGFYFHTHMPSMQYHLFSNLERIAAYCSDVILSQSQEDIETAIRLNICSPEKIEYLGNGINIETFSPKKFSLFERENLRQVLNIDIDAPIVGFVGRLAARRKGFLDFLKVGQLLVAQMPNIRFLIIGSADIGKPDAVSPEVAADFGIADNCVFMGNCPNEDMPSYYSVMDVLVLPSLFEGVPRSVMEAAAMGVPAIVSDVKGNREAVEHNRNGLLFPWGDIDALLSALMTLLSDPEERKRMGENGRLLAEERFDEQHVFAKVKSTYARLLKEKGLKFLE